MLGHIVTHAGETLKAALGKSAAALEKALAKKERLVDAKGKMIKAAKPKTKPCAKKEKYKPKLTPEELKAFRVELMAKARMAKKGKRGEVVPGFSDSKRDQ